MTTSTPTKLYRYEDATLDEYKGGTGLTLHIFEIARITPAGYWFYDGAYEYRQRWVSKDGRKRFAYPSKEEALKSFIIRKQFHLEHLLRKFRRANYSHNLALRMKTEKQMGTKLKYDPDKDIEFEMEDLEELAKEPLKDEMGEIWN